MKDERSHILHSQRSSRVLDRHVDIKMGKNLRRLQAVSMILRSRVAYPSLVVGCQLLGIGVSFEVAGSVYARLKFSLGTSGGKIIDDQSYDFSNQNARPLLRD